MTHSKNQQLNIQELFNPRSLNLANNGIVILSYISRKENYTAEKSMIEIGICLKYN